MYKTIQITPNNVLEFDLPVERAKIDHLRVEVWTPTGIHYTSSNLVQTPRTTTRAEGLMIDIDIRDLEPSMKRPVGLGLAFGGHFGLLVENKNIQVGKKYPRIGLSIVDLQDSSYDVQEYTLISNHPQMIRKVKYELVPMSQLWEGIKSIFNPTSNDIAAT